MNDSEHLEESHTVINYLRGSIDTLNRFDLRRFCISSLIFFLTVFIPTLANTQTAGYEDEEERNKIKSALESMIISHPYRLSIFRFLPMFVANTGYDSNVFFEEDDSQGDYYLFATPGVSTGVKLGSRAFFRSNTSIKFQYYRKFEERRDIFFQVPTVELVTGTPRLLVRTYGRYHSDEGPLDSDFDIPTVQRIITAGVHGDYALSWKIDLRAGYRYIDSSYSVDEDFNAPPPPPDNSDSRIMTGITYKPRADFHLDGDFYVGTTEFEESGNDRDYWRMYGGFTVNKPKLTGFARAGYGHTESGLANAFHDLLLGANLDYHITRRFLVGGFVLRTRQVSAFVQESFSLTTEAGVRFRVPLHRRLHIDAHFSRGTNEYSEEQQSDDTFRRTGGSLNFGIYKDLIFRAGAEYFERQSIIDGFSKDRFTYIFGFTYSLDPPRAEFVED